jgi:4-hydroxybenzoate polyprenyltransferase
MSTDTKLLLVLLIIALIVVGPLITIWALNTLFPALAIEYTFQTWLAAVILGSVFKTTVNAKQ